METEVRQMESATLGKLGEALAKAQGVMESAAKDSENPHFRSSYADLASIRDAIRAPLSANGLSFFQRVSSSKDGVTVETTLLHSSGEFVRDSCWLPVVQQTAQAFGSAITYARRYSLAAIVGVVADEDKDDDGNAATFPDKPQKQSARAAQQTARPPPKAAAPIPAPAAKPEVKGCNHEWDMKGLCGLCGETEPKTAPAVSPEQARALRARVALVWKKLSGVGWSDAQFRTWTQDVLGRATKSAECTADDVSRLESALQGELRASEPGAEG